MNEEDDDPTGGALYYAYLLAMDPGGWFERNFANTPDELPEVPTIGHLVFYAYTFWQGTFDLFPWHLSSNTITHVVVPKEGCPCPRAPVLVTNAKTRQSALCSAAGVLPFHFSPS